MFERLKERRTAAGDGGFTLIELLVVIIILGILAAVVVFAVGGVGDKGQSAACKIDTRTIRTAEEAFAANSTGGVGTNGAGNYGTMAALVPKFLSEPSTSHDVTLFDPDGPGPQNATQGFVVKTATLVTKCGGIGGETTNGTSIF